MSWLVNEKKRKVLISPEYLSGHDANCVLQDGKLVGTLIAFTRTGETFTFAIDGQQPPAGKKKQPRFTENWSWVKPRLVLLAGEVRDDLQTDARKRKRAPTGPVNNHSAGLSPPRTVPTTQIPVNFDELSPNSQALACQLPDPLDRARPRAVHTTPDTKRKRKPENDKKVLNRAKTFKIALPRCRDNCKNDCAKFEPEDIAKVREELNKGRVVPGPKGGLQSDRVSSNFFVRFLLFSCLKNN